MTFQHLGLEPRPQGDELGPIADQLTPVPHFGGGDPRLGQRARPQQIIQDLAAQLVVLALAVAASGGPAEVALVWTFEGTSPFRSKTWPVLCLACGRG